MDADRDTCGVVGVGDDYFFEWCEVKFLVNAIWPGLVTVGQTSSSAHKIESGKTAEAGALNETDIDNVLVRLASCIQNQLASV